MFLHLPKKPSELQPSRLSRQRYHFRLSAFRLSRFAAFVLCSSSLAMYRRRFSQVSHFPCSQFNSRQLNSQQAISSGTSATNSFTIEFHILRLVLILLFCGPFTVAIPPLIYRFQYRIELETYTTEKVHLLHRTSINVLCIWYRHCRLNSRFQTISRRSCLVGGHQELSQPIWQFSYRLYLEPASSAVHAVFSGSTYSKSDQSC